MSFHLLSVDSKGILCPDYIINDSSSVLFNIQWEHLFQACIHVYTFSAQAAPAWLVISLLTVAQTSCDLSAHLFGTDICTVYVSVCVHVCPVCIILLVHLSLIPLQS